MKSLRALPVDRHHWENPGSYPLHFLGSQWICTNHVKWLLLPTIFGTSLESPIDVFHRHILIICCVFAIAWNVRSVSHGISLPSALIAMDLTWFLRCMDLPRHTPSI